MDLLVKRRAMTDCLGPSQRSGVRTWGWDKRFLLASALWSAAALSPPCLTRVDRCRRLYESFMRASPGAGMDAAQFIRFAHRAALL